MPKHIDISEYRAKATEEREIVFTAGDRTFVIPAPVLWPEGAAEKFGVDAWGFARAILGDDFDAFVEAGGTGPMIVRAVIDNEETEPGESAAS